MFLGHFPGSWGCVSSAVPGSKWVPLMGFTGFRVTFRRFDIHNEFYLGLPFPIRVWLERSACCVWILSLGLRAWIWLCPIPALDGFSRWDQQTANYRQRSSQEISSSGIWGTATSFLKLLSLFIVSHHRLAATAKQWVFCGLLLWFVSSYCSSVL